MRYTIATLLLFACVSASEENMKTAKAIESLLGMTVINAVEASKEYGFEFTKSKEPEDVAVDMGYGTYLSDPKHGIELIADGNSIITVIHIYTDKSDGKSVFTGELPMAIRSADGIEAVQAKFKSNPSKENRIGVQTPLGKSIVWARYDIGNFGYHFSWDAKTKDMVQVTIMNPIPPHLK